MNALETSAIIDLGLIIAGVLIFCLFGLCVFFFILKPIYKGCHQLFRKQNWPGRKQKECDYRPEEEMEAKGKRAKGALIFCLVLLAGCAIAVFASYGFSEQGFGRMVIGTLVLAALYLTIWISIKFLAKGG